MKYFIRFVGHVIQQPGVPMPHEIYYDVIGDFDHEDMEPNEQGKMGLKQFVNLVTLQLMEHGMIVPKNPGKIQDGTKLRFDQRMGVGPHMLAYVDIVPPKALELPRPVLPELPVLDTGLESGSIFGESIN